MKKRELWLLFNSLALVSFIYAVIRISYLVIINWRHDSILNSILLSRTLVTSESYGNHSIILLSVIFTIGIILVLEPRGKRLFTAKLGMLSRIIKGLQIAAVHETEFYLVYVLVYGYTPAIIPHFYSLTNVTSLWLLAGPVLIIAYVLYFGKKGLLFLGLYAFGMLLMYIAWVLVGFPITISFGGATQWFWNLQVNGLEILSWVYACASYFIADSLARRLEDHMKTASPFASELGGLVPT